MARGGRGLGSQPPGAGRGGGRGGGGRGGGRGGRGAGGYRGRGRGGTLVPMTAVALNYDAVNEQDIATPPPPRSAAGVFPRTVPAGGSATPASPATPSVFRGRGAFGGGRGRGGRGGYSPSPMPFFINGRGGKGRTGGNPQTAYRQAQADEDLAYASLQEQSPSGGSGAATPHYGIGANKPRWEDRRGFGGSDPNLLKPIIFVKAGTLFNEGQVDVPLDAESFKVSPFAAARAAAHAPAVAEPQTPFPKSIETEPIHLPATFPPSFAAVHNRSPSPSSDSVSSPANAPFNPFANSEMDRMDKALRNMAFEEADEDEVEISLEIDMEVNADELEVAAATPTADEAPMQVEGSAGIVSVVKELSEAPLLGVEDDINHFEAPATEESPCFYFDSSASQPSLEVENETEPITHVAESDASPFFFVDSAPSQPCDEADRVGAESTAAGPVFGDSSACPAEEEEQIVWVPPNKKKNARSALRANPAIVPPSAVAASRASTSTARPVFDDYELSFNSVASSNHSKKKSKYQKTRRGQKAESRRIRGPAPSDDEAVPREGDSDLDWGDDGPPLPRPGRPISAKALAKEQCEAEILADYIANTRGSDGEQDDEGMQQFLAGTGNNAPQVMMGDIAIERLMAEEEAADAMGHWNSSSRGSSQSDTGEAAVSADETGGTGWATDDEAPDDASSDSEAEFGHQEEVMMAAADDADSSSVTDVEEEDSDQAFLDALLDESSGDEDSDMDLYSSDDEDLAAAIARSTSARAKPLPREPSSRTAASPAGPAKGKSRQSSSESDEDDEAGGMFAGNFSWADQDEQFIQDLLEANLEVAASKGRRAKKGLFRAIQSGEFGDPGDMDDLEEALAPAAPITKKSKKAAIPASLLAQWDTDRAKKAEAKRERAEARLAALLDPYSSKSKKSRNKAKRSKQPFTSAWTAADGELDFDSDGSISHPPIGTITRGGKRDRSGITNMVLLDEEIQHFLRDLGKTTMSLPPMEKDSRKRVHELADCYSLKSASKGAGRKRFTTLIKTSRSGLNPNRAKIGRILRLESSSYFAQASWSAKSGSGNHTMPGTRGSGGGIGKDLAKRREGEVVGEGAKMLGQDNLGHKLLSKMGWTEGTRIGKSEDGLAVPVMAIVKNSKTGLGHG